VSHCGFLGAAVMAPASLDLSLDEVIKNTKGESKGSGKGKGGRKDTPAKEEEAVSLDMSLDELIEKDYLPPKGKSKGWHEKEDKAKPTGNKNWESQGTWTEKNKTAPGGGGGVATWKGWKDTESWNNKNSESWKVSNDSWKAPIQAWKKADTWSSSTEKWSGGGKKDWSAGGGWEDDWKPKPRGDDWSSKWNQRETATKGTWDSKWNWGPSTSTAWEAPRQAWRPTNEQEREERWNAGRTDAWERRDDRRDRFGARNSGFESAYAHRPGFGDSYDVRDRRGEGRERSRTPPRRNYFDDVPRGNVILVKNIPLGLDSRDIRDAFQSATGTVESCKLSQDGTARISFSRPEDAKKAVATFDHGELNGRIISVNIIG